MKMYDDYCMCMYMCMCMCVVDDYCIHLLSGVGSLRIDHGIDDPNVPRYVLFEHLLVTLFSLDHMLCVMNEACPKL